MMITPNQQSEIVEERRNLAIPVVRQMPFLLEEENKGAQKLFHHFDTDIAHSLDL